jgi:multidrug resistance efflux pump
MKGENIVAAQCDGSNPDPSKAPRLGKGSTKRGPLVFFATLMGTTVGLSQRAGVRTGDRIVATGRDMGKILKAPAKLWPAGGASKREMAKQACQDTESPSTCTRGTCSEVVDQDSETEVRARAARSSIHPAEQRESDNPTEELQAALPTQVAAAHAEVRAAQADSKDARIAVERTVARAGAMESELAVVKDELRIARDKLKGMRAASLMQIQTLQSENESLRSDLRNANAEAEQAEASADTLNTELDSVRRELEEAQERTQGAQVTSIAKVDDLQAKQESLAADLKAAQLRAEEAESHANEADAESLELREALKKALDEHEALREVLELEQSTQPRDAEVVAPIAEPSVPPSQVAGETNEETDFALVAESSGPRAGARGNSDSRTVTTEEAAAATFSGAAEKVVFGRALSNLDCDDASTRAAAAKALAGVPHELSVRALVNRFHCEDSAEVREECLCALTALDAPEAIPLAEDALEDEATSVRLAAIRAIYRLVGLEGAGSLIRKLRDNDEDVRRRAVTCLGWLGHEPLALNLAPLLKDKSSSVRHAVLEALGNLKSQAVLDHVFELLDDPDAAVQGAAFLALETITGKKMGERRPGDTDGRKLVIARWRAWGENNPSHLHRAAAMSASN